MSKLRKLSKKKLFKLALANCGSVLNQVDLLNWREEYSKKDLIRIIKVNSLS